jgi:uncharacterized protein YndB with AHSA1/START domain
MCNRWLHIVGLLLRGGGGTSILNHVVDFGELRIQRTLPASPARVWQALTDPAALCAWFWPHEHFGTTAQVDLRVDGAFLIDAPTAGIGVTGRYVALEPPRRLVMTWRWNGEEHETLVTIELAPSVEGTELTLLHERLSGAARDQHAQGWSDCLDRLPRWLRSGSDPIPGRPATAP